MKRYRKYIIIVLILIAFCVSICFIPIDATRFVSVVEKQAEQEMGVQIHVEKLIFRFGPSLKIKAPVMHIMYEDGQKFGQLNNVKFYVPWSTLIKDSVCVKKIYADKFILKIKSDDKYLAKLIENFNSKDYEMYPNLKVKNYDIIYRLQDKNKDYVLSGSNLELNKIVNYHNTKLDAEGTFLINEKPYISYNLSITPNIEFDKNKNDQKFNLIELAEQI